MREPSENADPSGLHGWLSEVYFGALLSGAWEQLARRLGLRASVDDPLFGSAAGAELPRYLADIAARLAAAEATFDRTQFTLGTDRDVTEGILEMQRGGNRVAVPVGIVSVRRPAREIAMRLYFDAERLGGTRSARASILPAAVHASVPPAVAAHLRAMNRGDIDAVVASFEAGGRVEDSRGNSYVKDSPNNDVRDYYARIFKSSPRGITWNNGGRADDGRVCALEYRVDVAEESGVGSNSGLAVYQLGENGLLHALRMYGDGERFG
jgi:hypothetical protein